MVQRGTRAPSRWEDTEAISFFGLVARVVFIFGAFHKPRLFMWHLFLSDLEENGVHEKLLFNLHLICVY